MKNIILSLLFFFALLNASAQSQLIRDTETDIIRDLAFPPAQSDRSMNNGQMTEVMLIFKPTQLRGSNPKGTRTMHYELAYYSGHFGVHNTPTIARVERWEIDCRQNLRVSYVNGKLRITGNTITARYTELVNGQVSKTSEANVVEIPDVSANKVYASLANTLQIKLGALKIHIDRFYR